jgi:hypothetical protein
VTPALFDGLIVQAHLCLAPEVAAPHRLNAQDISTIAWAFAASREAAPQAYADHFGWRLLQTPFWEWDALSHADPAASLRARSESLSLALADTTEQAAREYIATAAAAAATAAARVAATPNQRRQPLEGRGPGRRRRGRGRSSRGGTSRGRAATAQGRGPSVAVGPINHKYLP